MLFSTFNNPMYHIFLILSYVYIFLSESCISLIPFSSRVSLITVSPAMPSTISNTSSQTPSVNGWYSNNTTKNTSYGQSMSPPCCPPAAPLLPATSLTSRPLLGACRNAGVGHCCLTPGQSSSFDQCAAHCLNKVKQAEHSLLQLVKYNSRHAKATTLGNGRRGCWQWWPTEMATAMADGDEDSNGRWQEQPQRQWQWLMTTQQRWWQQWLTATATATADGNGNGQRQRRWWWSRQQRQRWRRQLQWRQPQQGCRWQRQGCLFMWQWCAVLWQGWHLASTPMDTKESAFTSAASWGWHC